MWHFVNGVCYFDRGKVCQRCKGEPSLTYLFCLSCNQTTNFYLPSSIISYYLEWKRNSSSSPKPYSCSLSRNYHHVYDAIYMKRESELTVKYLFECLQSIMISNWLFALYCPQPCIINRVTLFKSKWNGKFSLKCNIPVLLLPESVKWFVFLSLM